MENNFNLKKKITIDLRMILSSGIGTYLSNLIPLVISSLPYVKFSLLGKPEEIIKFEWSQDKHIEIIDCRSPIYSISEQYELLRKIPENTDLFWSPHFNIPILYKGKLLVTIHDLFHLALPEYVGGIHKQLYAKAMFSMVKRKASSIVCVSNYTMLELERLTRFYQQNIDVVYNGVDDSWFQIKKGENPHQKPYLLYVGNVKPHKNLFTLIQAFEIIKDKIPHDLVIVGKKEGFITGDHVVASKASGLGDRVRFTGFIEDEILKQYFAYANALVFPSLYEGFGLPPLEAMASGCPVIVSNTASLPEVCGDAVLYCDPRSPQDIADKIQKIIYDYSLRDTLNQKGLERAKLFTWEKCASETVSVIEEVLRQ
jgi:glycosyltransferase involved in cell wall biosynthesis